MKTKLSKGRFKFPDALWMRLVKRSHSGPDLTARYVAEFCRLNGLKHA